MGSITSARRAQGESGGAVLLVDKAVLQSLRRGPAEQAAGGVSKYAFKEGSKDGSTGGGTVRESPNLAVLESKAQFMVVHGLESHLPT